MRFILYVILLDDCDETPDELKQSLDLELSPETISTYSVGYGYFPKERTLRTRSETALAELNKVIKARIERGLSPEKG